MIFGIGTDICDVRRVQAALARRPERFAQKILTPGEIRTWQQRQARWPQRGVRFVASRFSAKEAFSKAIGLGLRLPMRWQDCEVVSLPGGAPAVRLHGALQQWFAARGLKAHLSLSDEGDYVVSFCVVENAYSSP